MDTVFVASGASWLDTTAQLSTTIAAFVAVAAIVVAILEANRRTTLDAIDRLLGKWESITAAGIEGAWDQALAHLRAPRDVRLTEKGRALLAYLQALETVAMSLERSMLNRRRIKHSLRGLLSPQTIKRTRIIELRTALELNFGPGLKGRRSDALGALLALLSDKDEQLLPKEDQ